MTTGLCATAAAQRAASMATTVLLLTSVNATADCGEALDAKLRLRIDGDAGAGASTSTSTSTSASARRVVLVFVPRPAPLVVGRHFEIDVVVCGDADLVGVDAEMPAHRHGMNYRTSVQPAGDGRYLVQGLMFHMPGQWRYQFTLAAGGRRLLLTQDVELR